MMMACPWWLGFACTDKKDVLKLNFTLAALEAKDPFTNLVNFAIKFVYCCMCVWCCEGGLVR